MSLKQHEILYSIQSTLIYSFRMWSVNRYQSRLSEHGWRKKTTLSSLLWSDSLKHSWHWRGPFLQMCTFTFTSAPLTANTYSFGVWRNFAIHHFCHISLTNVKLCLASSTAALLQTKSHSYLQGRRSAAWICMWSWGEETVNAFHFIFKRNFHRIHKLCQGTGLIFTSLEADMDKWTRVHQRGCVWHYYFLTEWNSSVSRHIYAVDTLFQFQYIGLAKQQVHFSLLRLFCHINYSGFPYVTNVKNKH